MWAESLIRRGEVVLDFDVIDGWYDELERMNEGKRGAACDYPGSFVQLLGYVKAYFHLPYGQTQGVVMAPLLVVATSCGYMWYSWLVPITRYDK